MSDIQKVTLRLTDTPPKQPGKASSPTKSQIQARSPKVREQSGSSNKPLFSPSSGQAGCIPAPLPRATRPAADSPYKSPSSKTGNLAPDQPVSPRAYLQGLRPDNLSKGILRDQTTANAETYPTAWISQVQASLEAPLRKLHALSPAVLAAMPESDPDRLYPAIGSDEGFDWKPFRNLCAVLWPAFSGQIISVKSLPPRTLGLLAEFHAELTALPTFSNLPLETRNKVRSDGLFNLLIWNGIFSPLTQAYPQQYTRLVNGLCSYVKAAWGIQAQTQGSMGQAIIAMVPADQIKKCADFQAALTTKIERLAALRTVKFHDKRDDARLNKLRETSIDRHFTETWRIRTDDYSDVVKRGNYYLTDASGVERRCRSYKQLKEYVGRGSKNSLPEVVLHVAGDRIRNFLSNTYLYDIEKPLFMDAHGNRVDPIVKPDTKFILSRNNEGRITVTFSCCDRAVESVMLVSPGDDSWGADATPLFQASVEFHGKFHFFPDGEEFEAGNIHITGQNLHLFE